MVDARVFRTRGELLHQARELLRGLLDHSFPLRSGAQVGGAQHARLRVGGGPGRERRRAMAEEFYIVEDGALLDVGYATIADQLGADVVAVLVDTGRTLQLAAAGA